MKPQPEHVSMMIKSRMRARQRRLDQKAQLAEDLNDLSIEQRFEAGLKQESGVEFPTIFSDTEEWCRSNFFQRFHF